MHKKPMLGVSICTAILLVLGSLSNVVGYQTDQSSNQKIINEEVNLRELLYQTIVDITNIEEIQRILLKSQISREGFFNQNVRFPVFKSPVITKNQLRQMYLIGLMLSKVISQSRIQSMVQQNQLITPEIQQEISAVIERDATLKGKIAQLQNSECDCENKNLPYWNFPVICSVLLLLILSMNSILSIVYRITGIYFVHIYNKLVGIIAVFAILLKCNF